MAWFLLVFVLGFGVALMHTLGHPADHDCPTQLAHEHDHGTVTHQAGPPVQLAAADQAAPVLAAPAARSLAAGFGAMMGGAGGRGALCDAAAICLAVLTLGGILLGLAALRGRRVGPAVLLSAGSGAWRPCMLDPPARTGLMLARVSVLRI